MLLQSQQRAAAPAAAVQRRHEHASVSNSAKRRQRNSRARQLHGVGTCCAAAVDSSTTHAIVARLVGSPILTQQDRSVVPLLCPPQQQLPFAAAVHVFPAAALHPQQQADAQPPSELVEVWYSLCGSGVASKGDTVVALSPGDTVLCMQGDVAFAAGAAPPAAAADLSDQQHTDPQQQQQHDGGLVMLQLLLPAELLTGQLQHDHAGHCDAVAQRVRWFDGVLGCSVVDVPTACQLLSSAHRQQQAPQQHAQQQHAQQQHAQQQHAQQQHAQQQLQQHPQASQQQRQHAAISHGRHEAAGSSGSSGSSDSSVTPSSSADCAHVRLHLSRAGVVKRGLAEVVSYRLPRQTNRLALLLGPHNTSPAISLSFGVEVFEPGHVTPYHVHNGAHELFMVLAGCAEAVHGPDRRRVALAPGDVAVFPPGVKHGLDNTSSQQLYCLQMMLPNESFVEFVRSGQAAGALDPGLLQRLAAAASCG